MRRLVSYTQLDFRITEERCEMMGNEVARGKEASLETGITAVELNILFEDWRAV